MYLVMKNNYIMVNSKKILIKVTAIISLLLLPLSINAAEVVYRIDGYNKAIQDFTIVASGLVPQDSWAYFENEYGATTGNRFNQIPRNRQASATPATCAMAASSKPQAL